MGDHSQPSLDRDNQTSTIDKDCKRRIVLQPGLQERHESSQPVSSAGDDTRWHPFQSETNANDTSKTRSSPAMDGVVSFPSLIVGCRVLTCPIAFHLHLSTDQLDETISVREVLDKCHFGRCDSVTRPVAIRIEQ